MKIYNVGKDSLDEYDLEYLDKEAYEYLIYNYEVGDYQGDGSCYGPLEERNPKCIYSLEEIIKLLDRRCQDKYDREYVKDVAKKLKELEG